MDYKQITEKYYSEWIGNENILCSDFSGVRFVHTIERNNTQYGYSQIFDLYILVQEQRIIVSYGDKMANKVTDIKNRINNIVHVDALKQMLKEMFGSNIRHSVKYNYVESTFATLKSRPLVVSEYPQYLEFFKKVHPHCNNTDWVKDYFFKMINEDLCCGLFDDNILACCSDAPSMPYMQNVVQEIGINTLPKFQGKGYATDVCISCSKAIIKNGKVPQWSTTIDNIASQKLARKIGFDKFADVITVTI